MKKAIYIIIALIAFIFGISVYYVRPLFFPVSLSELRNNDSEYKHLKIKVVAKLEVYEIESRYSISLKDWENGCSGEPICYKGLVLSEELIAENVSLIKELAEKNKTVEKSTLINEIYWADGEYYVDVEISGRLVEKENPFDGGKIYDIKVEQLKQKSPIKFVPMKEMLGIIGQ